MADSINLQDIRKRHIWLMRTTCGILGHILKNVTKAQSTDLHDGPEGWSIIEIVCHLKDFNEIFLNRAKMMLNEDHPELPGYDHEQMAIDKDYQSQDLAYTYLELVNKRKEFVDFFKSLDEDQWQRSGIHPERGHFTMLDALLQVGLHETDHIEQITRILEQEEPASGVIPESD